MAKRLKTLFGLFAFYFSVQNVNACCPSLKKEILAKRQHLYKYDTSAIQNCRDVVTSSKYKFMQGACFQHANFFAQWWCSKSCLADCKAKPGTFVSCQTKCNYKNVTESPITCQCGSKCQTKSRGFREINDIYERECLSSQQQLPPKPAMKDLLEKPEPVSCKSESHFYDKADSETKAMLMEALQSLKSGEPLETDLAKRLTVVLEKDSKVSLRWTERKEGEIN